MIRSVTTCDVCGIERQSVNHWYVVRSNDSGLLFPKSRHDGDKDVCGQVCAHKMLDRWLSTGTIEAPNVPANE